MPNMRFHQMKLLRISTSSLPRRVQLRLLRNRLAALESRERKKRYIEKLEKDNKQLNEDLDMATEELAKELEKANDLEHQVASLKKIVDDAR
ncbi:putative bzip transcription factor [Erysiphe neolycopersici]|uniref:Putative bzip transcription factor n=1 Tax=Erysiphe neolycopersici TaxID=212602 RepID=A0A420I1H7_9PEZI|nr:putative bzip transcription factor [Erysiphe neolycopersici]